MVVIVLDQIRIDKRPRRVLLFPLSIEVEMRNKTYLRILPFLFVPSPSLYIIYVFHKLASGYSCWWCIRYCVDASQGLCFVSLLLRENVGMCKSSIASLLLKKRLSTRYPTSSGTSFKVSYICGARRVSNVSFLITAIHACGTSL